MSKELLIVLGLVKRMSMMLKEYIKQLSFEGEIQKF